MRGVYKSGVFFMLFHMQVMILVLGAEENRKQLRVGFLGDAGVLTVASIFIEGSMTISGICETASFVEFCSLLMGWF